MARTARSEAPPKTASGSQLTTAASATAWGAVAPPARADVEHMPTAAERSTVGKSSAAYTKMDPKVAVTKNLPTSAANTTHGPGGSAMHARQPSAPMPKPSTCVPLRPRRPRRTTAHAYAGISMATPIPKLKSSDPGQWPAWRTRRRYADAGRRDGQAERRELARCHSDCWHASRKSWGDAV